MLYSQKLQAFTAAHTLAERTVDGARFRYILCGKADGKTLVFLNGGMNTLEMWMDYADKMADDYRVLLFDYPQALATNQAVVKGMHAFFKEIGVTNPIFVGASDGGMVAQIYVQKYPGETGGLVLVSTGGMDARTLKSLKRKYCLAPLMLRKYPMSPAVTCPRCSKRTNIARPSARFWNAKGPAQTEETARMYVQSNTKSPYLTSDWYGLFISMGAAMSAKE